MPVRTSAAVREAYWRAAETPVVPRRRWRLRLPWHALSRLAPVLLFPLRCRPLRNAAALAVLAFLVWKYVPLALLSRPLHHRAAFTWEERFDEGLSHWVNASALEPDRSGAVRVHGMALHGRTMTLRNYEMQFSARVQKRALGWVVRGAASNQFHAFKLTDRGRSPRGRKFELTRPDGETVSLVVPVTTQDFLDITVRVSEDQILTTINGYGADAWKHPKLRAGGAGLLAEKGESFLVRSLTISGNEDFLGLLLRNLLSLIVATPA
jgi:hypothetical protein